MTFAWELGPDEPMLDRLAALCEEEGRSLHIFYTPEMGIATCSVGNGRDGSRSYEGKTMRAAVSAALADRPTFPSLA